METEVTLQNPMQFHWIWLVLPIVFLVAIGLLQYFARKKWPLAKKQKDLKIKKPSKPTAMQIRKRYLAKLDDLQNRVSQNSIGNREAYQELSMIIRMFAYEMTSIPIQNYTLKEISLLNYQPLTNLVEEYYLPEFAQNEPGHIESSLTSTREVISRWN